MLGPKSCPNLANPVGLKAPSPAPPANLIPGNNDAPVIKGLILPCPVLN